MSPINAQDLIDQTFMAQEAADRARWLARRAGHPPAPDRREAAVELAQAGVPLPPGGWVTPVVDVNRTPLPPVGVSTPAPVKPEAYCKYCGKLFKAKTVGGARLSKGRHEKREHVHDSATGP